MNEHAERAFIYRQQAEELRTIAEDTVAATPREILLKLAADYERLASIQDKLALTEGNR
jgi:hypothetical protein